MRNFQKKRRAHLITLILIALYLSLVESLIPKPFPWMKLGLANLTTLIAFIKFDRKMAVEVFVLRVVTQSIMLGTFLTPSFVISFLSGLVSVLIMIMLFKYKKYLSVISISISSAVMHNLTQLIIVYFLLFKGIDLNTRSVYLFIIMFLIMGIFSGGIVGYIAYRYVEKEEKFGGLEDGKKVFWNRWNKRGS